MQIETRKLIEFIDASNLVMLEHLLKTGVDPNLTSVPVIIGTGSTERIIEIDATPLMLSSAKGDIVVMRLLLEYGANSNAVSETDGETALHWAARNGNLDAVTLLLEHGANSSFENKSGQTPAALALVNCHHEVSALLSPLPNLIKKTGQVQTLENSSTPFGDGYYHPEYTQQLINNLVFAAPNGVIERMKAVLAQGAPIDGKNDHGCTALYAASFAGQIDAVKLLLSHGSDVNIHNADRFTALGVACDKDHYQVAKYLVQHGADVNVLGHEKTTALLHAAWHNSYNLVELLLESGANPNIVSDTGNSPLCIATLNRQTEIVKLVLNHGADPNLIGYDGWTALAIASGQGNFANASALLEYNASPNMRSQEGRNALALAAGADALEVVKLLIDSGADINQTDDLGNPPIVYAMATGTTEGIKLLLSAGANVQLKDKQGRTPLSLAQRSGRNDIISILETGSSNAKPLVQKKAALAEELPEEKEQRQVSDFETLQKELNALTGMANVKANVAQMTNLLKFQKLRKDKGLSVPEQSLHMVFTGNPGTGKTTIARLIAQIYKSMGILSKGQFIETDRAGLVGGYLGQTAIKTQEVVESALGGVLFVDEAYSLTISEAGRDEFGYEAVNTLLKLMEDHRDDLIVIVAGYTEPMQKFIRSNPGLQSRFNKFLHFDDYAPAELTEIFGYFAAQGQYKLHPATELKLFNVFTEFYAKRDETFGNARLARNLFEKTMNNQASRVMLSGKTDEASLVTLYPEDVPNG